MNHVTRLAVLAALVFLAAAPKAWAVKLGVLCDSISDEYFDDTYGYAENWTVQLVNHRGIDMGSTALAAGQPGGTWGEPRRTGYEYNWARAGADSIDLLANGQHTGLAAQVVPEGIDYAVLMIGANDQFTNSPDPYRTIYFGAWTPTQITTWVDSVVANIDTALATVVPTGTKVVLFNAPDYGVTPAVNTSIFTNPAGRQMVHDVLANQLNPQIEALAAAYNLPYVDLLGALDATYGPSGSLNSTLAIGNVDIQLQVSDNASGTDLTAGFVHDEIHPHTTIQGILANLVMESLNIGYGANLTLFSEQEILAHRGIAYGGSDTLQAQFGDYSDYVTNFVPEPSTVTLAAMGFVGLAAVGWRRRKR